MRAYHAKTKDYCMTRFFGHGQSILQVFETPNTLNMVESVKCHLFLTLLDPISWALAICERCGIKGHFKVCCRTKQDQRVGRATTQRGRGKQHVHKKVRTVTNDLPRGGATSNPPPQGSFFAFYSGDKSETLTVSVENSRINAIIDSGASCNFMSQAVLEQIQIEAETCLKTTACDRDVYPYASTEPLKVIGVCKMRVLESQHTPCLS